MRELNLYRIEYELIDDRKRISKWICKSIGRTSEEVVRDIQNRFDSKDGLMFYSETGVSFISEIHHFSPEVLEDITFQNIGWVKIKNDRMKKETAELDKKKYITMSFNEPSWNDLMDIRW